jgi:hypothetical protein
MCLSSNRFNKYKGKASSASVHVQLGKPLANPFERCESLNILIEAQILTVCTVVFLKHSAKMPGGILLSGNSDTYHNEAQIQWIFCASKRSCG